MSQNLVCLFFFFFFFYLFSHLVVKSLIIFARASSFPHSKCIVVLTGVWLKWVFKGRTYFFIHPLRFFTLFSLFWLSGVLAMGLMKGDNGSWAEDIDFSFLLSRSLFSPPRWNFNVLSSHFYILWPAIILIHLSLCPLFHCLHLSLHISLYTPHTPPTHTH